ncbi:hypothetical protein [uncultured Tessaracoccus sp.]|uniref:hypothetical protein n=1 Tax=uncultured Tessaracoccus sp. TaxID=905023 RepID=UPI0025E0387B|nr:hypothetical protein [uncultured Tessaracoccus sp.]
MQHAFPAALVALGLALVGCTDDGSTPEESPTPSSTTPAPSASPEVSGIPSPVATTNQEDRWDDWGEALPDRGEVQGAVQLVRIRFVSADEVHAHLRIAVPEALVGGGGVDFCNEGPVADDMVGFGTGWQAEPSEAKGYRVCDTTATFPLAKWGAEASIPAPTLADGVWHVNLGQTLGPEDTVGLYRMRLEFPGTVQEASEGARVVGSAATWSSDVPVRATAAAR